MSKKAAEHEQEGTLDLALVISRRAACVCDILKEKTGFTSTALTPFYLILSDVIRQAESLRNRLKPFFEASQENSSTGSYPQTGSSSGYSRADSSFSSAHAAAPSVFMLALNVVKAVEKERKSALILDFRAQKDKRIQYRNYKAGIKVLSVDPLILMPGCSIPSLLESLDFENRRNLWSLNTYDLLILVDDEQRSSLEDYAPKSATQALVGALTTVRHR